MNDERFDLRSSAVDVLAPQIVDGFLASFATPHAVAPSLLIGDSEPTTYAVIQIAASSWSARHLERLRDLATQASQDPVVHENFVEFFRRLDLFSSKGMLRPSAPDCPTKQLVRISWTGATAEPLQYRMIGSLESDRRDLSAVFDVELSPPDWWEELGPVGTPEEGESAEPSSQ